MLTSKGRFYKRIDKTNRVLMMFEVPWGRWIDQKSIRSRSKKAVNMGRHLGIDISSVLVDWEGGGKLGGKNRGKIDQRWHRKKDETMKRSTIAKEKENLRASTCVTRAQRPWGGGMRREGWNPMGWKKRGCKMRFANPPEPRELVRLYSSLNAQSTWKANESALRSNKKVP